MVPQTPSSLLSSSSPSTPGPVFGVMPQVRMKNNLSANGDEPSRDMKESQRVLELRKFFAPQHSFNTPLEQDFNDSLNNDGALDAYAETVVWRLKGVHAMVSLVDRDTQYFLAGAVRKGTESSDVDDVMTTAEWFGCSTVPTPGGLCENTLSVEVGKEEYPCFIANDLSRDDRFATLPVVDGSIAAYRFYAGVPITTNHGVNIGSFFLFDDKPRDGLTIQQKKFMHRQASNVMKHLETKREAAERRRVALMSKGIATFLERTSQENTMNDGTESVHEDRPQGDPSQPISEITNQNPDQTIVSQPTGTNAIAKETVLDKIRYALDQAADILRESLELSVGGVVFLDTALGYAETGNTEAYLDKTTHIGSQVEAETREEKRRQASNDSQLRPGIMHELGDIRRVSQEPTRSFVHEHNTAKVLAMSAAQIATWDLDANIIDAKTLQSLINTYPKGNVWYTDEDGYFSSLEQVNQLLETEGTSPSGRRRSITSIDLTNKKAEATMLSHIFHKARQIIFLPLWDAGQDRWYAGCFVWSRSAVPVFTVDSEVAYLSAFTNSVMVEISRLDAITSNKMKSDFISSISHEFRSPLHGILASAELLRESDLDASQIEFISTITNCSGTLLDTINHVLDYSKINSFEKTGKQKGITSNELIRVTNLALLCEDSINGMMAASEFHGAVTDDLASAISKEFRTEFSSQDRAIRRPHLDIILDIECREWYYNIQAGALRRVVMNIFGNAQKYTELGYILVQMRIRDTTRPSSNGSPGSNLYLNIRDSGKGMSAEYMERKLYHPFAQEDSFAPGIGLGLSIVWSIVNQLGGQISISSQVGKGTNVEITIPVEKAEAPPSDHIPAHSTKEILSDAEIYISQLQSRAIGKSVCFSRTISETSRSKDLNWTCIEKYCRDWFGFAISSASADLTVSDQDHGTRYKQGQRVLVVHDDMVCSGKHISKNHNYAIGHIFPPIGPFRLARSLLTLMDQDLSIPARREDPYGTILADRGTQTPLGSPLERTIMNGIILTDYGFKPEITFSTTLVPQVSQEIASTVDPTTLLRDATQIDHDQYAPSTRALSELTLQQPPTRAVKPSPLPAIPPPSHTFYDLRLPLSQIAESTPSIKPLHILAVDDNTLNLQLLNRYLMKRKVDTIVNARDGLEAVNAVRQAGTDKKFDVIFMDISMPNMNGFEATRAIRSLEKRLCSRSTKTERKTIESENSGESVYGEKAESSQQDLREKCRAFIVALTGLASRRDRDEAEESGFDDFFTKPISFVKIGELLKKLSQQKLGIEKLMEGA